MRYALTAWVAALGIWAGCGAAAGSIAYATDRYGSITRFDPYSNASPVHVGGGGGSGFVDGLTIDGSGRAWTIDWEGRLTWVDLVTGVATQAGTVPEQSGWYKDLAWDSANNRILAMHFGPGVDIGVLDPFAHTFTSLGIVSGLSPAGHFTGLAVGPHGEMAISDDALGHVWDVISSNGALMGVQRSAMVNPSTLHGLEFDPDTGDLLTSDTINIVRADGSLQMLRSDVLGDDLAFMPVPGPAAGLALITIGAGYGAVRRPRGG